MFWKSQGAKKGDAIITAQLELAGVSLLISDNRHFLHQIPNLPFRVLSSREAVELLRNPA